ncbi:MAG TPA: hypothetical protein VGR70_20080 [Stellaceae bacterium]|nr:hypothetical protein [Stellaceae bacterium]
MRRLIAAALVSLLCAACSAADLHQQPVEQRDAGHVDTGGGGGGGGGM